jgi:uncharacterized membrane protein (GlpM family)
MHNYVARGIRSLWKLDFSQLKDIKIQEYLIRFLFGGAVSVLAQLITQWTTGRIGGIFTAFPAILLASLTIINRQSGREAAENDARGGIIGAIAFVITAIVLTVTLEWLAGWSLLLALLVWLVCGIGLYTLCVKMGWLCLSRQD